MKKHYLYTQIYTLLLLSAFLGSCKGQVKTSPSPDDSMKVPVTIPVGQAKMVRSQNKDFGNVGCEIQDRAGNIWFCTGGQGVYRYDGRLFTNFTVKDGLNDDNVSAIIEDKAGNILFATNKGICKYDGRSFSRYSDNAELNTMSVSCLLEDREGNLWMGTLFEGVYRYDGKTLANFLNNNDRKFHLGNPYQTILHILQDKSGDLWFSSWNGGGAWRYDGRSFTEYLPSDLYYQRNEDQRTGIKKTIPKESAIYNKSLPIDSINDDMIFSISEDKAGNIWFATRNHGACRYDGKTFFPIGEHESFYSGGVYDILEDRKGNIWLATNKYGVWHYDGKTFKNYTTKDGLVNDSVFSILEDKAGNLWFGTRAFGLSRYDGHRFTTFSE